MPRNVSLCSVAPFGGSWCVPRFGPRARFTSPGARIRRPLRGCKMWVKLRVMPRDAQGDAAHLAFASFYKMDFLLTWNCAHLANANKARHISVVNGRLGLFVPVLTTPELLIPETD